MKAKKIRRILKDGGVDWREAKHVQGVTKDRDGNEQSPPTIFLDPKCGKAIYRRMKKKLR